MCEIVSMELHTIHSFQAGKLHTTYLEGQDVGAHSASRRAKTMNMAYCALSHSRDA
jgi:hypothetical protein